MFLKFFEIKNVDFSIGMSTNMDLESDFYDIRKKKKFLLLWKAHQYRQLFIIHSLEFTKTSYNLKTSFCFSVYILDSTQPIISVQKMFSHFNTSLGEKYRRR